MRKFSAVFFTLLLVVVLLAVEVVIVRSASKYEPVTTVVFTKAAIPEGTEIEREMLTVREVSLGLAHKKALRDPGEAVGKKAMADIESGEMLLDSRIGTEETMEPIMVENKGSRLFTVEFKADQANGWWLMVGQCVDIIFVPQDRNEDTGRTDRENGTGDGNYGGIIRLNNIRIAALIDEKGALLKNSGRDTLPRYISFEVDGGQDQFLAYAKSNGRLEISAIPEAGAN